MGVAGVSEVVLLHAHWVEDYFVLPGVQVFAAEVLDCAHRVPHKSEFDVFAHAVDILLHLLESVEFIAVCGAVIDAKLFVLFDYVERKILELDVFVFF